MNMGRYIQKGPIVTVVFVGLLTVTAWVGNALQTPTNAPTATSQTNVTSATQAATKSQTSSNDSVALAYDPTDGSLLKADRTGLLRWQAGADWEKVNVPQNAGLSGVIVNPDKPTIRYVSGPGLGVARSDDSGSRWQAVNSGLPNLDVTALALHSFRRETLYAWVRDKGIYRTEDGGAIWKQMRDQGPPDTDVRGLIHSTLPGSMNTGWLYADTPTGAYIGMDCF